MMQTLKGKVPQRLLLVTSEMKVREHYPTRFCFMVKLENFKPKDICP
jgi:hypothetical protein